MISACNRNLEGEEGGKLTKNSETKRLRCRGWSALVALSGLSTLVLVPLLAATAEEEAAATPPEASEAAASEATAAEGETAEVSAADSADAALTGDDIYHRILDNRFSAYIQELAMTSGDRGGNHLKTEVTLRYKNYRKINKRYLSKSIAKYKAPQDVRHLGYLVINKQSGHNDEFIYQPSARKVRRVNLRGEAVFGTDFSFEDIIPQEFEDGTYRRLPDEVVSDIPCFVVDVTPTEKADSEYSKFVVYVEKAHYVPLRTDYWDKKEIKIKQLMVDTTSLEGYEAADIEEVREVWIATSQIVRHLKLETWTELEILSLESKPKLRERDFSERELTSSH